MAAINEFIIFSDESYIVESRFRGLSAFSMPYCHYQELKTRLQTILNESSVSEFKWNKLNGAKYYFCAEKMINFVLKNIGKYNLRIDSIVWDTQDSRHKVPGRNDIENYERMCFHLFSNSMRKRQKGCIWHIKQDSRSGIDWATIHDCLSSVGKKREYGHSMFGDFFSDPHFHIRTFSESKSHEEHLIQIADLFSGLSVYSKTCYNKYRTWKSQQTLSLFDQNTGVELSKIDAIRCHLLDRFNSYCKQMKLGVSLDTKNCLYTFDPNNSINFWHYEPQGDYDKAPTRN